MPKQQNLKLNKLLNARESVKTDGENHDFDLLESFEFRQLHLEWTFSELEIMQ